MEPSRSQRVARVRFWPSAALVILCAALYLPGLFNLPVVDRDEARFAQATRQMLDSGDYINIEFQDLPRAKKPIGIYWAQAVSAAALRSMTGDEAIWPYRLPSALGAMLAVWLLQFFLRPHVGEAAALLAAALLAASVLLTVEAHVATADALLLASVVAAQGALMRRLLRSDDHPLGWSIVFWIAQAIGVLIKGPIAPLVSIMTLVGWRVSGSRVRPLRLLYAPVGLALAALIIAPWVIAVSLATDGSFFADAVTGDLFPKMVAGQESHGFPPGFYLLIVTVTFWPGSLLAGFAVVAAWRGKRDPLLHFLLAWLIPTWIIFEIIPTKLPHYVLPLFPALAAITAVQAAQWSTHASVGHDTPRRRAMLAGWIVWSIVTLALGAAVVVVPIWLDGSFDAWSLAPALAALAAVAAGFAVVRRVDAAKAALWALVLCSALFHAAALAIVLPRVDSLWPSRAIARIVQSRRATDLPWAVVGYHEPSVVFALGRETQLMGPVRAADALAQGEVAGVIIQRDASLRFNARTEEVYMTLQEIGRVRGLNISKGEWIDVLVYVVPHASH